MGKAVRAVNVTLGGGGASCTLVLFYFVYHYNWIRDRVFTSPTGITLYEVFPAVLAALLLASLRLRPSHKIKLALLLFSTGVSIYIVELSLRLSNATPGFELSPKSAVEMQQIAKAFGVDFDTRRRSEVIMDLRKKGIDALPATVPQWLLKQQPDGSQRSEISINGREVLPLGGVSNRVTVLTNEIGEYAIYESDEHGFHNPKGIWDSGRIAIAALGDSFTQGYSVPSDKNFVALIRKCYPATLNLGGGGNGPLLELATLKEYAGYVEPQVVLWFYCEDNDLKDLNKEKRSLLLMRYVTGSFQQGLFSQQVNIDNALAYYIETAENTRELSESESRHFKNRLIRSLDETIKLPLLRDRLGLVYGQVYEEYVQSQITEEEMDLFRNILLQAKAFVSAWGGRLYFVYLPSWIRYGKPELAEKNRDRVLAIVKTIGLPVIDLHSAFQVQGDPLALFPFRLHAHYTVEGNRLVAEETLRSISLGN